MRGHLVARLILAAGLFAALLDPSPALAQKVDRVKFDTCDGVELHGSWYGKDAKSTCVILLHNVGGPKPGNSQQDGWDRLAKALNEKGFAVLAFDFRGHGNSTSVVPGFWQKAYNAGVRGGPKSETINHKDFQKSYYPILVNDIAAAKAFLDRRNDSGECNSRSIILIGAQEGAALGVMWLASEWHRFQVISSFPRVRLDTAPEGKNVIACVWLSMTGSQPELGNWLKAIGKDKKVPMGFLYGANDATAASFAQKWAKDLKGTTSPTKELTAADAIAKSSLAGSDLLRKDLDTVDRIATYCTKVISNDKITPADPAKVEFEKKGYAWSFGGAPIPGKGVDEKLLQAVPLANLGVRVP
jgi:hypothetical protein